MTQLLTVFIKCFLKTNLADQAASPATIKQATAVAGNIRKAFTPPGHYTISIWKTKKVEAWQLHKHTIRFKKKYLTKQTTFWAVIVWQFPLSDSLKELLKNIINFCILLYCKCLNAFLALLSKKKKKRLLKVVKFTGSILPKFKIDHKDIQWIYWIPEQSTV